MQLSVSKRFVKLPKVKCTFIAPFIELFYIALSNRTGNVEIIRIGVELLDVDYGRLRSSAHEILSPS